MAERSLFWPTTGTGDGDAGGYSNTRLRDIWQNVLGDGVLRVSTQTLLAQVTGSNVQISAGTALVKGYLYENTATTTIPVSTLGTGTFGLYVIANESASAITVSRTASGTTIDPNTVRLALNATTPTQPYIQLATVTISGGLTTGITKQANRWSYSRGVTRDTSITESALTASITIPNNALTTVNTNLTVVEGDYVIPSASTGTFTVNQAGVYHVTVEVDWDTNTTGIRQIVVAVGATPTNYTAQLTAASFITATATTQWHNVILTLSSVGYFQVKLLQNSGAVRTVSECKVKVARY